jgi:hypothetical protein
MLKYIDGERQATLPVFAGAALAVPCQSILLQYYKRGSCHRWQQLPEVQKFRLSDMYQPV